MLWEYRGDGSDNCGIPAGMDFIKAGMVGEFTGCENFGSAYGIYDISRCNREVLAQKPEVVTVSQHHRIFN